MRKERITILDVAREAKVSKVTVSYVLNGLGKSQRISDDTATRVLHAAQELGYRPNALARMLATRQTRILAVVFQRGHFFTSWSPFISEVMRGVSQAAVERGYDLMLHTREVSLSEEPDVLADGRVDGALVLRDDGDPTLSGLAEKGLPFVQFFSRSDGVDSPFVDCDNYAGGRIATRHLLELGHRRIVMVKGSLRSTSSNDRYGGYREALESAGIGVAPERVISLSSATADFEPLIRLLRSADRPTALFVWSDDVALECLRVAQDCGLRVPEDLSVVGFDSLDICNRANPPLTSVRQEIVPMAIEATRMLVDLIEGHSPDRRQLLFPPRLDLRSSTAPCPVKTS